MTDPFKDLPDLESCSDSAMNMSRREMAEERGIDFDRENDEDRVRFIPMNDRDEG